MLKKMTVSGIEEGLARALNPGNGIAPSQVWRPIRHRGEIRLLLPLHPLGAAYTLSLYAPQRKWLRRLHALTHWVWVHGFPLGFTRLHAPVDLSAPLVQFLARQGAEVASGRGLGVFAGNSRVPGQRYLLLCLDGAGRPQGLVKAGFTDAARALIRQEVEAIGALPAALPHVVRVRDTLECPEASALAMDWIEGRVPTPHDEAFLPVVLGAWIQSGVRVRLGDLPLWQRIEAADPAAFRSMKGVLRWAEHEVHPVVFHGDFAPWNVRITPDGAWQVFDWERGEARGIPGFNWLHYGVQHAVLVRRMRGRALAARLRSVMDSKAWREHLAHAGWDDAADAPLRLYVRYMRAVFCPTEGVQAYRELEEALG